ncbi:hypothetical protein [Desertihabitans aurantiacus]|uniref:hypothetical protein n=1 Tax=Desertihabitans aurantiacus TaxID=2282477 RepID=UPI000DF7DD3C|nr:hypothetical protein [Desertihabitans aurantiacus]
MTASPDHHEHGRPEQPLGPAADGPVDGGDGAEQPERSPGPGAKPLIIGITALVLVLAGVVVAAFLTSRMGASGQPTDSPTPPPPPLALPLAAGELSRDPNATSDPDTIDTDIETVSATYQRNAVPSLVVIAGRPVSDPARMLELVQAEAVRPVQNGLCGRDAESGFDVCVAVRGNVSALGVGIAAQPITDIMDDTNSVLAAMEV